jgi:hypothetical protein
MLDHLSQGEAWAECSAETEYQDNAVRAATRRFAWALEHLGLGPAEKRVVEC